MFKNKNDLFIFLTTHLVWNTSKKHNKHALVQMSIQIMQKCKKKQKKKKPWLALNS